jgi:hypothetical protein
MMSFHRWLDLRLFMSDVLKMAWAPPESTLFLREAFHVSSVRSSETP